MPVRDLLEGEGDFIAMVRWKIVNAIRMRIDHHRSNCHDGRFSVRTPKLPRTPAAEGRSFQMLGEAWASSPVPSIAFIAI
jgi:hypothetical protein